MVAHQGQLVAARTYGGDVCVRWQPIDQGCLQTLLLLVLVLVLVLLLVLFVVLVRGMGGEPCL